MAFNPLKRLPLSGLSEFRRFLYNGFILPWRDPKLAYLYITSLLFAFAYSFLDLFIVIDLVQMPLTDMLSFLVLKSAGVSALVCLTLWIISRFGGKVIYPFISAMISGALVYVLMHHVALSSVELGIIYIMTNAPFWALYHIFFAISISDENVGNEVALAGTGLTIGTAIGFFAGGFVQALDWHTAGLIIGFSAMAMGTALMMLHGYKLKLRKLLIQSGALDESLLDAFKRCRYRCMGSLLEALIQIGGGSLWIIFLSMSGITAAGVGIWNAVMVLVKIFFTPIAGALINHGQRREMLFGSSITAFGWIPFLFTTTFALPAMYIWSIGNQLYSAGLNSAWYRSRTLSSLMAREIILGTTRLIFMPIMLFVIYAGTHYFIYTMIVLSVMMVAYSAFWMRSIKIKGPVMAIENIVRTR